MRSPLELLTELAQMSPFHADECDGGPRCFFCPTTEEGHHGPECLWDIAVHTLAEINAAPLPTFCKHCGAFIPGAKSQTSFCPKPATCRKDHRKAVNAAKYSDLKRRARGPKPLAVVPYDQLGHAAISLPVAPPKGVTHLALVPVRQKTKKPGLQPAAEAPNA
jgi:hypothetical protein